MGDPTGEADKGALRLDFDRRLLLQFRGSTITSDAGLLVYRELDDTLGLTDTGAETLADARSGKNGRHRLAGLLRQSVFGRLAGYEGVNDAERLCRDPAMRWVVGDRAITGSAASASQMGRFETKWLSRLENLVALADLAGQWIDKVHQRRPPKTIVLDMDSSESPTYGDQEGSTYNGHFGYVVADQPVREADQDWREGRQPRTLHHVPNGRGGGIATDVCRHPVADRPAPGTTRARMRSQRHRMWQGMTVEVRFDAVGATRFSAPAWSTSGFEGLLGATSGVAHCSKHSKGRP